MIIYLLTSGRQYTAVRQSRTKFGIARMVQWTGVAPPIGCGMKDARRAEIAFDPTRAAGQQHGAVR
ncbi:MAG: hypothetical protein NVSMB62_29510 [Acidobacteriaceae bacterium]